MRRLWAALPCLCASICASRLGGQTSSSPWNGTWKLNKTTFHALPPPLTLEILGEHYTLTQGAMYHFDCDGKDSPASHSDTLRCTASLHGIKVELKHAGQLGKIWEIDLHANGVDMTDTVTEFRAGGQPSIEHDGYRRSGPGSRSIAASWIPVRMTPEGNDALEFQIHDGFLHFRATRDGATSDAKLDGTPAPFINEGVPPNITWSNVLENERRIVGHPLKDGKAMATMIFELSEDGRSVKASIPTSPSRMEAIYEKQ